MTNQRITDTDAAALLAGTAPAGRPELATLAAAVSEFRASAVTTPPEPSAALRERLEGTVFITPTRRAAPSSRARRLAAGAAGLGLLTKIVLGSTVAFAAVATVGAVGVLPTPAQNVFDRVVSAVIPGAPDGSNTLDTPVAPDAPVADHGGEQAVPPSEAATPAPAEPGVVPGPVPATPTTPAPNKPTEDASKVDKPKEDTKVDKPKEDTKVDTPKVDKPKEGKPKEGKTEEGKTKKDKVEDDKSTKPSTTGDSVPLASIGVRVADSSTAYGVPNGAGTGAD